MKIGLALAAMAIVAAVLLMLWSSSDRMGTASAAEEVDLSPLVARVEALEKQNGDLRRAAGTRVEAPGVAREPAASPSNDELAARVLRVEMELADLRSKLEATPDPAPEAAKKPAVELASVELLNQRARDVRASEADRLAALRELRGLKLSDGSDARLAVLDDMLALAQSSTNAETRADIWRQLNHITDPRLKRALLDALSYEKDAKARAKACDTMRDFMPDPDIEAALRQAAASDPSPDVKAQATSSLGGKR